jgi:glycosyltransferase involved in cell wall biosynthesis
MRILIPIIGFGRAGGYRVLSELANHWIALGAAVDFLVDHRGEPPYFPTLGGIRRFGRDGREVASSLVAGQFEASGNAASIYLGMWRALRRLAPEYDVVLANQSLTAWPVAQAPRPRRGRRGRVYYIQAYEPDYYQSELGWKARVLGILSAASYRLPLRRVVNAPIYLRYRSIRSEHWAPPGIDAAIFTRRSELPGASGAGWTLGVIGRREPAKGTADALAAFEQLASRWQNVHLKVAYGNLPPGWSHPRATVVTPANDAELAAYYRSLDVMLAPGTLQLGACHYPVIEAMASGVAVVTTGYLPADETNAWIVPVHAPESIAAAVEQIMLTEPGQLSAKLQRAAAAVEPFAWGAVASRFLALLRDS